MTGMNGRIQRIWNIKFENREIVLFGTGDCARQFYRDFHKEYSFTACISNGEESALTVDGKEVMEVRRPETLGSVFLSSSVPSRRRRSRNSLERRDISMEMIS